MSEGATPLPCSQRLAHGVGALAMSEEGGQAARRWGTKVKEGRGGNLLERFDDCVGRARGIRVRFAQLPCHSAKR